MADPGWLVAAYGVGTGDAIDDGLKALDVGLGAALHDGSDVGACLASVDAAIATVDASRLSPAMAVGVLRFLHPVSGMLPGWAGLRERVRADLAGRPGLDVVGLLHGLD